jgi:hypothetical protein
LAAARPAAVAAGHLVAIVDAGEVADMGKVINLNKARKRKAREAAERQAAENRVRFGRTPAEKQRDAAEIEAARKKLEHLKREDTERPE